MKQINSPYDDFIQVFGVVVARYDHIRQWIHEG